MCNGIYFNVTLAIVNLMSATINDTVLNGMHNFWHYPCFTLIKVTLLIRL